MSKENNGETSLDLLFVNVAAFAKLPPRVLP